MISNLHPADALLALKAQIADLEARAEIQRAALIAMGIGHHDGDLSRANVIESHPARINWKVIAETLKPSLRFPRDKWSEQMVEMVDGNTVTGTVITVKVNAKPAA
jgi:hypothetical protein